MWFHGIFSNVPNNGGPVGDLSLKTEAASRVLEMIWYKCFCVNSSELHVSCTCNPGKKWEETKNLLIIIVNHNQGKKWHIFFFWKVSI